MTELEGTFQCPYCNTVTAMIPPHAESRSITIDYPIKRSPSPNAMTSRVTKDSFPNPPGITSDPQIVGVVRVKTCGNPDCKERSVEMDIRESVGMVPNRTIKWQGDFQLKPKGKAKPQPEFVPPGLRESYNEACLILEDSPKASGALSRRCLQGIIRDFFTIAKNTLYDEIEELKERDTISPQLFEALHALREIVTVCVHPEKDVDVIIDISKEDAATLISVIEFMIDDTYIARHNREEKLNKVIGTGDRVNKERGKS